MTRRFPDDLGIPLRWGVEAFAALPRVGDAAERVGEEDRLRSARVGEAAARVGDAAEGRFRSAVAWQGVDVTTVGVLGGIVCADAIDTTVAFFGGTPTGSTTCPTICIDW